MADQVVSNATVVGDKFMEFLKNTPEALAKFVSILKEFYELQGQTVRPVSPPRPEGPLYVRPDEPLPPLVTVPLTREELDAMMEDRADAQVKEKALEWAKGFLTGLFVAAIA